MTEVHEHTDVALERLQLIAKITEKINSGRSFDEVFGGISRELSGFIPCDRLAVGFLDADGVTLRLGPVHSTGRIILRTGYRESIVGSSLSAIIETGLPRIINDIEAYLAMKPTSHSTRIIVQEGMRASLTVPLIIDGRPVGVMWFSSRTPGVYEEAHESFIQLIAGHLAILLEKGRLLSHLARASRSLSEATEASDRFRAESRLLRTAAVEPLFADLVGESPAWRSVLRHVELAAPSDTTVLILGETGTGKELVARAIHRLSDRSGGAFVAVHGAALAPELVASELFGHERGAFTGAVGRRIGRFELANGGTLFLDEVGDLPPDVQVKLLRVLQERIFERVGGTQHVHVDVRIVAATNRNLDQERAAGRFRDDLYYRLNVLPIMVPPLRERREDIEPLILHFLRRFAVKTGKTFTGVAAGTIKSCLRYHWPGNIRELENLVERAVVLSSGPRLDIDPFAGAAARSRADDDGEIAPLDDAIRAHLVRALRATSGKIYGDDGAARLLNIKPSTLQAKLKRYGVARRGVLGGV